MFRCKDRLIQTLFIMVAVVYSISCGAQTSTNMTVNVVDNKTDVKFQRYSSEQLQGNFEILNCDKSGILLLSLQNGKEDLFTGLEGEVYSLTGKTATKISLSYLKNGLYKLDTSELAAGTYILKISFGSKAFSGKFDLSK